MSQELDFLLDIDGGGVVEKDGASAYVENLREWLHTPVTTRYGNPAWGNNLSMYKHEPMCSDTARSIENSILLKLPKDCPQIRVAEILCTPVEKDMYRISIFTNYGLVDEVVSI
ncbi:hypothetical protein I3271_05285 [Photobacterium leiognathi]|uniref:hypothetical protein n=1 Tax=Photobacterium leiognathi TaxID=553611 RepID=UPI001EE00E6F|nr:hypothetical protein [Photobacterium leiognathi]MCG3884093.1 hypothetical protein [Photobacterium leiognathi]